MTAKDLFVRQGITQTTTRQIADAAGVNEVTLFRHFGTKQGLLLAAFADLGIFDGIGDLGLDPAPNQSFRPVLVSYIRHCYEALTSNPELVCSVVGEAGLYSEAHKRALQEGFSQAQIQLASYLQQVVPTQSEASLSHASAMLHLLILGAAMLQVTTGRSPFPEARAQEENTEEKNAQDQDWNGILDFWLRGLGIPNIEDFM